MEDSLSRKKLVLDTSVLIEYIVLKAPLRSRVAELFDKASSGKLELYISVITLSETLYIASRVYEVARLSNPNDEALNYLEWIRSRVKIVEVDEDIAFEAGELKKALGIAIPDCYVIATARSLKAIPVFKKIESEMKPILDELRKLNLVFLDEINML